MIIQEDLDPRLSSKGYVSPGNDLELLIRNPTQPEKALQVGKFLNQGIKTETIFLLANNLDVFAWKQLDMVGINPNHACHILNIDPKVRPIKKKKKKKKRLINVDRYAAP